MSAIDVTGTTIVPKPEQKTGQLPVEGVPAAPSQPTAAQPQEPTKEQKAFAHLARKERALRQQTRQLQAQQKAFEAKQAAQPQVDPNAWKTKLQQDPLSVFQEAGLTQEQLTNLILNSQPQDIELRRLKAEIESLKGSQQDALTKIEATKTEAYKSALKQVSREVKLLVQGNESYEAINARNAQDAVVALVDTTYKEDGILLTAAEAAQQVEEYLIDEGIQYAALNKVKAKMAPPTATQSVPKTVPQTPQTQPKTLTHAITQQSAPLSSKDRRARAIAAFNNQLK